MKHPQQPRVGRTFAMNPIVDYLYIDHPCTGIDDLKRLIDAERDADPEDWIQFLQLVGWSVDGSTGQLREWGIEPPELVDEKPPADVPTERGFDEALETLCQEHRTDERKGLRALLLAKSIDEFEDGQDQAARALRDYALGILVRPSDPEGYEEAEKTLYDALRAAQRHDPPPARGEDGGEEVERLSKKLEYWRNLVGYWRRRAEAYEVEIKELTAQATELEECNDRQAQTLAELAQDDERLAITLATQRMKVEDLEAEVAKVEDLQERVARQVAITEGLGRKLAVAEQEVKRLEAEESLYKSAIEGAEKDTAYWRTLADDRWSSMIRMTGIIERARQWCLREGASEGTEKSYGSEIIDILDGKEPAE